MSSCRKYIAPAISAASRRIHSSRFLTATYRRTDDNFRLLSLFGQARPRRGDASLPRLARALFPRPSERGILGLHAVQLWSAILRDLRQGTSRIRPSPAYLPGPRPERRGFSLGPLSTSSAAVRACSGDVAIAQIAVAPPAVANATDIPMRGQTSEESGGGCRERRCFLGTPCGRARRRANSCPGRSPRSGANCGARRSSHKRRA